MQTIQVKVYEFTELAPEVQEKVIEKNYDINSNDNWYEFTFDDAKQIGSILGFDIDKIYFSGFHSQGDGACITGKYSYNPNSVNAIKEYAPEDVELHEIAAELLKLQKRFFFSLEATITHTGRYYHEKSVTVDCYSEKYESDEKYCDELTEIFESFMRWIYRSLETEYNYLTSREAIVETIEANEYQFLENGRMFTV